ncbi:MAG: SOS response-associated peptidase [Sphingobacteriia bacterium]|nr:SOS response-associated peptidase [Sphingobacteriia bacterium]NCC41099.1 SOS response-associated peptidase [Gammaproteobacteria bacterium]
MCGRYVQISPPETLAAVFEAVSALTEQVPRYNAAPLQWLPVIRQRPSGERVIHALRWGLLPSWAKDERLAARLINARAETLSEKPAFRSAYRARRCLVPADGFYEWAQRPQGKQPYYIHARDGQILALAGLWERWSRPDDGTAIDSFCILTTAANALVGTLHERMPLILEPVDWAHWLERASDPPRLRALLAARGEERLTAYPVSSAVGSVRQEGPELIRPLTDPRSTQDA